MDEVFTTDPAATPVHVVGWGVLGDTWPFFRPNFTNMENHRQERGAEEVRIGCMLPGGRQHTTASQQPRMFRPRQGLMLCSAQVVGFVPTGWMYEMKKSDFPVRKKGSCQARDTIYPSNKSKTRFAVLCIDN